MSNANINNPTDSPSAHKHRPVSVLLADLCAPPPSGNHTIGSLMEACGDRSFALLMMILAMPIALPIPAPPGVTLLIATPMLLIALQMLAGRHTLWLPAWVQAKTVKQETLEAVRDKSARYFRFLERFIRPRLAWLSGNTGKRLIALLLCICSLSVATPIPLTNTVPSMGIVLICIALMERDGLLMLLGACIGTAGLTIAFGVLFLGQHAISQLFS